MMETMMMVHTHTHTHTDLCTHTLHSSGLLSHALYIEAAGQEVVCPYESHIPTLSNTTQPTTNHTHNTSNSTIILCPTPSNDETNDHKIDHHQRANHSGSSTCHQPPIPTNQLSLHVYHHHIGYSILIATACIVLVIIIAVSTCNICSERNRRRRHAKYKSVSKFFPFSYGQHLDRDGSDGVAIPEYGLPKAGQAEREVLLNESDEDEI